MYVLSIAGIYVFVNPSHSFELTKLCEGLTISNSSYILY